VKELLNNLTTDNKILFKR